MSIWPVILCGGAGKRLWPCSTADRPKQFFAFTDGHSLFQGAVRRIEGIDQAMPPIVVANVRHAELVKAQLEEIGAEAIILAEPVGRDSAAAVAAASAYVYEQDPEGVIVAVASDHLIPDTPAFCSAVRTAAAAARKGAIVIFGVRPSEPATAYGYIQASTGEGPAAGVSWVKRFVEKPGSAQAADYIRSGFLWNSGNFVFAAQTMLDEIDRHAPDVSRGARAAVVGALAENGVVTLGAAFAEAAQTSLDYAVMEKTSRAAVLPVDYAWSDLGAWDAVMAAQEPDADGNAHDGHVVINGSRNCLVRETGGVPVIAVGLSNVVVVAEAHGILVCDLASAQLVKHAVDRLVDKPGLSLEVVAPRLTNWLLLQALPLWWTIGADHRNMAFHERLDQSGRPLREDSRIRVQARQIDVFATARELGWEGPWEAAIALGLAALERRHRRPDGLYRTLVDPDGEVLDDKAFLYDQAFVLLALAGAAGALPERRSQLEERAREISETIRAEMAAPGGGFAETGEPPACLANPLMHLFEATLAWDELSPEGPWRGLADELANLALERLIQPDGSIRETYTDDWRAAEGEAGARYEPGHQHEWTWLLTRWARRRGDPRGEVAARRLFAAGERGLDPARGVVCNAIAADGTVCDAGARLWPQTERLKAALILGEMEVAASAANTLCRYLNTAVPGLWRDRLTAGHTFVSEPAPASSLYHIATAVAALARRASLAPAEAPRRRVAAASSARETTLFAP